MEHLPTTAEVLSDVRSNDFSRFRIPQNPNQFFSMFVVTTSVVSGFPRTQGSSFLVRSNDFSRFRIPQNQRIDPTASGNA
ncbi:hypothetical protein NG799_03210 [Laspinema sp. D1]|uniref:Uncharacterized protein n=1 Tax=Laspinema palackyanum D2a TaxID=2953684 RepID=A0ABT2MN65_9CYAN|nr:hypothetical protein [Laspinema sp. D2b]MCT7965341.1 hypothetical protein [Laspinema sp. D2a]